MRRLLYLPLAVLMLVLGPVAHTGRAQAVRVLLYDVTDLGTLGGAESEARAINERSEVVGWAETELQDPSGKPVRHGFIWSRQGGMTDLGTLGGTHSEAYDVNDRGQVVGWASLPPGGEMSRTAFIREPHGQLTALSSEPEYAYWSEAYAVNNRGEVVGSFEELSQQHVAGLWSDRGLRKLNHSEGDAAAQDINDSGTIVGYIQPTAVYPRGAIWPGRGRWLLQRPRLDCYQEFACFDDAYAINKRGDIIGESERGAFLRMKGAIVWLHTPGRGDTDYYNAVNDQRQAVGSYKVTPSSSRSRACRWHGGRAIDLNDHLTAATFSVIEEALDINNRGEIVGIGRVGGADGPRHAFLLTPR